MEKEQEVALLNAIGAFLVQENNVVPAGKTHLHVQCVQYVLNRIKELTGGDENEKPVSRADSKS